MKTSEALKIALQYAVQHRERISLDDIDAANLLAEIARNESVLQQALDALNNLSDYTRPFEQTRKAMDAIKERLK